LIDFKIKTNHEEDFLLINDKVNNIMIFSTTEHLKFLCKSKTIYVDSTFKCYGKMLQ